MKFYLSSYKLGNKTEELKKMIPNKKIGYIPSALDAATDLERQAKSLEKDVISLQELGLKVEVIQLKDYFNKNEDLRGKIKEIGAVFVRGGNTFVLRQAMGLSGLDKILKDLKNTDFLYSGYSAAGCVLSATLKCYQIVDDPNLFPYPEIKETPFDGLGLVDFALMPHYKSDHPESKDIDKEIEFCEKNKISYRAIKDGEVIII